MRNLKRHLTVAACGFAVVTGVVMLLPRGTGAQPSTPDLTGPFQTSTTLTPTDKIHILPAPSAKRQYTIEFVSVFCDGNAGSKVEAGIQTYTNGPGPLTGALYAIPIIDQGVIGGDELLTGSQPMTIYSDPGQPFRVFINTSATTGICQVSVSGRLVAAQ